MFARFAFTPSYCGDSYVVCRVVEGCAEVSVVQEFGTFPTWAQAQEFARRLNIGLGVTESDSRQLVIGAFLALAELPRAGGTVRQRCDLLPTAKSENPINAYSMVAARRLAVAFCNIASNLSRHQSERAIEFARKALSNVLRCVASRRNSARSS